MANDILGFYGLDLDERASGDSDRDDPAALEDVGYTEIVGASISNRGGISNRDHLDGGISNRELVGIGDADILRDRPSSGSDESIVLGIGDGDLACERPQRGTDVLGDEEVGWGDWHWYDTLAALLTGGGSLPIQAVVKSQQSSPTYTRVMPGSAVQRKGTRAAQAQADLDLAKSVASQYTRAPSAPLNVPAFSVPSFDINTGTVSVMSPVDDSDALAGCDILGAAPRGKKTAAKKSAGTGTTTRTSGRFRIVSGKGRPSPHKAAVRRADIAAQRAEAIGKAALKKGKAYNPRAHTTLVPVGKTTVNGTEVLGAAKPLTAKQTTLVSRHNATMVKTLHAHEAAKKAGQAAVDSGKKLASVVKTNRAKIDKLLRGGKKTTVHGYAEILGDWDEICGDDAEGAPDSTDTSYGEDVSADEARPTRDQPLSQDEASIVRLLVPDNGVVYDGRYGWPQDSYGSWNTFYGEKKSADGKWGYGWLYGGSPAQWMILAPETKGKHVPVPKSYTSLRQAQQDSTGQSGAKHAVEYGPLIGNPNGPLANMQFAQDEPVDPKNTNSPDNSGNFGVFFWNSDNAPSKMTKDADDALVAIQAQKDKTLQDAADAEQARQAAVQADIDEAKAKSDAAIALAQTQADAEDALVQQKLTQQQTIAQAQQDVAQAALEQQAAKADLDYAIAHRDDEQGGGGAPDEQYANPDEAALDEAEEGAPDRSAEPDTSRGPEEADPFAENEQVDPMADV